MHGTTVNERAGRLVRVPVGDSPSGLTPREVEVVQLLAAGKRNQEIATELVLSVPTIERHIFNIYNKIGARNRAEAIAYAFQHGLHSGVRVPSSGAREKTNNACPTCGGKIREKIQGFQHRTGVAVR